MHYVVCVLITGTYRRSVERAQEAVCRSSVRARDLPQRDPISSAPKKLSEMKRLIVAAVIGVLIGIFIGATSTMYGLFARIPLIQIADHQALQYFAERQFVRNQGRQAAPEATSESFYHGSQVKYAGSYHGAEALPPGIIEPTTDLYQRRLWGNPNEDLLFKQKYLVTFTVGFEQRDIVNSAISKFSKNWTIVLFHYDGRTSEWDRFEWSKEVIHISARKQTKWWFAKRFLHPDVVAPYEYVFIWDEDLDVQHFNAEEYIRLVKKHGLEISQPGLEPNRGLTWQMTKRLGNSEVHKSAEERPGWCHDPLKPPCAGFVEIMAPVFTRNAWRCVWHMLQNDLVHGWGLDFALGKCVEPAHEKIGVVDSQYIVHKVVPSLGNQGEASNGRAPWEGVRQRCHLEWQMFRDRLSKAEKAANESRHGSAKRDT